MRQSRSGAAKGAGTAASEAPDGEAPTPSKETKDRPKRSAATAAPASEPPPPNRAEVDDQRGDGPSDSNKKRIAGEIEDLKLQAGFERVVETVFSMTDEDTVEEYRILSTTLKLEGRASDASYGSLVDALDEAEEKARRASVLAANSKVAMAAYDYDAKPIVAAIREAAVDNLKANGNAKPTLADIDAEMSQAFTDEYRAIALKMEKAKRMVDVTENLSYRWQERAKDLRQMVARARDVG